MSTAAFFFSNSCPALFNLISQTVALLFDDFLLPHHGHSHRQRVRALSVKARRTLRFIMVHNASPTPPPPPMAFLLRACFTRVEFLFCRPLLLLLPFTPLAPFTGSSGCGGSEARCGGNGKQARQPGIFTHRLAFASHWHTCGVPALRPLPLQRGVLCVPVLLVGLLSY